MRRGQGSWSNWGRVRAGRGDAIGGAAESRGRLLTRVATCSARGASARHITVTPSSLSSERHHHPPESTTSAPIGPALYLRSQPLQASRRPDSSRPPRRGSSRQARTPVIWSPGGDPACCFFRRARGAGQPPSTTHMRLSTGPHDCHAAVMHAHAPPQLLHSHPTLQLPH